MLKRLHFFAAFVLLLGAASPAQEAQNDKKVLKNADIVMMAQHRFDDAMLVKIIEVSDTDFDISSEALLGLKDGGVSPTVIRAMKQAVERNKLATVTPAASLRDATPDVRTRSAANANLPAAAAGVQGTSPGPASMLQSTGIKPQQLAGLQAQMGAMGLGGMPMSSYAPEQMPHVFLLAAPKQEISPSTAEIAQSKFKGGTGAGGTILRSLAMEGLSFASAAAGPAGMVGMTAFSMASGIVPGMRRGKPSITYAWGLPGLKSSRELTDPTPRFELSYGEIPGVDPDKYEPALVKLVLTKDNYRLVGATQIKMDQKNMMSGMSPEAGKWVSEERWPTHLDKEERGFFVMRVDKPLEPGEYAVVLRPVKGYKAAPSGFGGAAQVFYSVWDFSVPGAPPEDTGKKKKK